MTDFPSLQGRGPIAIDVETYDPDLKTRGLGAHRDGYIAGIAVATEGFSGYYPIAHEAGENLPKAKVLAWLKRELSTSVPKIGANLLYDLAFLSAAGVNVADPFYDIQVAEPLLDENRLSYSLENLAQHYLKTGKRSEELSDWIKSKFKVRKPGNFIWRAPAEIVARYAIGDVEMPLQIFKMQEAQLKKHDRLWDLFLLESSLIPMLLAMRQRGVRVAVKHAEKLFDDMTRRQKHLMKEVGTEFAPWNARDIAKIFDRLDLEYPLTENTKAPSFTKEWLAHHKHPTAQLIHEIRHLDKLRNTFVKGAIIDGHYKGRLHCSFNQLRSDDYGAVSGRFSSSNFNLQQIPIRSEDGKIIRSLFLPDADNEWGSADYCVAPETRILTTDLQHLRADQITPGIELVGFDENYDSHVGKGRGSNNASRRKLRKTKVLYTKRLRQPCYRIVTNRGSFTSSSKHKWLAKDKYSGRYEWQQTNSLKVGSMIPRVCNVWDTRQDYEAGWMAGFLDGEGYLSQNGLGFGQNEGACLQHARTWLENNNYDWNENTAQKSDHQMTKVYIQGGRHRTWELVGSIRPVRLLPKVAQKLIEGFTLQSRTMKYDTVTAIEFIGEQDVVAIQTEHKTIVANGLASHNSQIEYRLIVDTAADHRLEGAQDIVHKYKEDISTDFHQVMADLTGLSRYRAKTINFALAYGAGVAKICQQLDLDIPSGTKVLNEYHTRAPFIRPLAHALTQEANRNGQIETLLGRVRRFNMWEKNGQYSPVRSNGAKRAFTYRALNAFIQGSAADVLKQAMSNIWKSGVCDVLGAPHLTVHDELDFSVPKNKAGKEAFAEVKHIMETAIEISVPLLVDTGIGKNWGEVK